MRIAELYEARGRAEGEAEAYEREALAAVDKFKRGLVEEVSLDIAQVHATLAMALEIRASRLDGQIEEFEGRARDYTR